MISLEEKLLKQIHNLLANEGFQISQFQNEYSVFYMIHENFKIQIIGSLNIKVTGSIVEVNLEFDDIENLKKKYNLKNRRESIAIFSDIEESCSKYKSFLPNLEMLVEAGSISMLTEIYESFTERFFYPDIIPSALILHIKEILSSGVDEEGHDLSNRKEKILQQHLEWLDDYK